MSHDSAGAPDGNAVTIAEVGEFGLIRQITSGLRTASSVLVGPGDDAAVVDLGGPTVCSSDVLVEGRHFRRDWSLAHDVGRKAAAANLADIEAMGARPVALVVAFAAPGDLPVSWARQCSQGLAAEAAAASAVVVGGDVATSSEITIAVTALGALGAAAPVRRSGARPGQVVALRGRVGWAAAGLVVLSRGFRSPRAAVEAQLVPQVPYGAGVRAAEAGATAMIDISDGLLADLGHVARASGVVIDISRDAFEVPEPLQAVAGATGSDPYALMLTGGEDHALAATFDQEAVPEGWQVIGQVLPNQDQQDQDQQGKDQQGQDQILVDGEPWEGATGYEHFRR